ncbi:MAG TPA: hypothetical protein VFM21_09945 [Terriglobia bacterium]|nr:hypothetical protein [Terriglobia bacterium]
MRAILLTILPLLFSGAAASLHAQVSDVELKSKTAAAFNHYIQGTQARIDAELKRPGKFLYIDSLPAARAEAVRKTLRDGQIYMQRLVTRDASGEEITAPDALIHHWLGDAFVPGATIQDVINVAQDYDHHQDYYQPEVIRSRLLSRQGNDFKIFYRLRKKKVITVTLDSWHDVRYFPVDATHWHSRSVATRIQEIENAGQKDERAKPIGDDSGFLWRLDSWWRFEEKDGGVYIECEAISLTRDIPTGLGWLIKPFVTSIPRESLQNTMSSTRATVLRKLTAKQNHQQN